MSMYTELLDATRERRAPVVVCPTEPRAIDEVLRCRGQLEEDAPAATHPDTVPTVLAREIGYDVALLQLAEILGIETEPSRFEQPEQERARLERAFRERGLTL
jgi:hypothetical protein